MTQWVKYLFQTAQAGRPEFGLQEPMSRPGVVL